MDIIWEELVAGMPDARHLAHVLVRLAAAAMLGAVVGFQRERAGKPAGLRTHMLVTLGTAVFVLACSSSGMDSDGLSRVSQGIITGEPRRGHTRDALRARGALLREALRTKGRRARRGRRRGRLKP